MYNFIAQADEKDHRNKRHLLLAILLPTAATVTLMLVSATWYLRKRACRNKVVMYLPNMLNVAYTPPNQMYIALEFFFYKSLAESGIITISMAVMKT